MFLLLLLFHYGHTAARKTVVNETTLHDYPDYDHSWASTRGMPPITEEYERSARPRFNSLKRFPNIYGPESTNNQGDYGRPSGGYPPEVPNYPPYQPPYVPNQRPRGFNSFPSPPPQGRPMMPSRNQFTQFQGGYPSPMGYSYAGYIERQARRYPIMMYTLVQCVPCQRAKHLLAVSYSDVAAHFLELVGDEDWQRQLQVDLQQMTGQATFPYMFICGQHIGGSSDLFALHQSGQLRTMLNNCAPRQKTN